MRGLALGLGAAHDVLPELLHAGAVRGHHAVALLHSALGCVLQQEQALLLLSEELLCIGLVALG